MIEKPRDPAQEIAKAEPAETTPAPEPQKHRTVGNKIYDWGVYGSIAWLGVAALSLLSAHEAKYGKNKYFGWLRWIDKNATQGFVKLFSKTPFVKNASEETIKGLAGGTTMFLTLGMGGNALMAPIKWMEDNRQRNAACIDHALGTTPPDPAVIEAEPKQTWKSVLSGRMFSWGLSYAAFLAMGPKLTKTINNKFGEAFTNGWMKMRPASDAATVRKWADIGAFDALFTFITAGLTYTFSRYIAKRDNAHMDTETMLMTLDPGTPTPFTPVYNTEGKDHAKKPMSYTSAVGKAAKPAAHSSFTDFAAISNDTGPSL